MRSVALLFTAGAMTFALPAAAHHNFAAHYDLDKTIEITGVVTEFRFVNPHARLYIDVVNANGQVEKWMAEGDASVGLRRSGWTENQLKPGDRVEIVGSPSIRGLKTLSWSTIALTDGTLFGGGDGRLGERLRILNQRLAEFRAERDRR